MALHILKQGTPTWGNVLGQSVGHGINALTKTKLERMKENEDIKLFTSLGIDPIEARLINKLPEKQRSSALASVLESLQKEKQSEEVGYQSSPEEPAGQMTRAPQQGSSLSNILGGQSNQAQPNITGGTAGGVSMDLLPEPLRQALEEARNPRKQERAAQQQVQYEPTEQNVQPGANLEKPAKASGKHSRLIAALRGGVDPAQKLARERFENQKYEFEENKKAERFKATKAERKEILDNARVAKNDLRDLERLEELEKSGNLDTPGYVEFLKRSGLDIPALMNPESEEFQKIQLSFLRNAKTYYGGRVSNFEVEQFLKTIPSLSQTPEGRKRVFANLKNMKRGEIAYKDALKEVMQENDNIPPYDILEQIDDRIDNKLDKLADQFREDISRPVPKGQNKFITALQAGAGSLLGALGGTAQSALKGAAIGSTGIGGLGAAKGALLGGGLKI